MNESLKILKNLKEESRYDTLDNITEEDINNFYNQVCSKLEDRYGLKGISEYVSSADKNISKTSDNMHPKTYVEIPSIYNQSVNIPILGDIKVNIDIDISLWGDGFFRAYSYIKISETSKGKSLLSGKYDINTKQIVIRGDKK